MVQQMTAVVLIVLLLLIILCLLVLLVRTRRRRLRYGGDLVVAEEEEEQPVVVVAEPGVRQLGHISRYPLFNVPTHQGIWNIPPSPPSPVSFHQPNGARIGRGPHHY
jgi:hypothetical protein